MEALFLTRKGVIWHDAKSPLSGHKWERAVGNLWKISGHSLKIYEKSDKSVNRLWKYLGNNSETSLKQSLNFGIAHIENTSKPGGEGNICLAGHRDSFFKKLEKIHLGDIIEIDSFKGFKNFKVVDIQIISPNELHWLNETESNILTLVTCYPFDYIGEAPMRYIIRAKTI